MEFQKAIEHWWASKNKNAKISSKAQGGTRSANLRGDTMDGFRDVIVASLKQVGVHENDIFTGSQFARRASNLPAYFRATKNWDVIICKNACIDAEEDASEKPQLIAAIEFKSQNGSIGNNQNNRIEESIGNAVDFWEAYENRTFGALLPRPWLGYLFVGMHPKGDEGKGVEICQPLIQVDRAFAGSNEADWKSEIKFSGISYSERYRVFLERMIAKKLYDGASFIVTDESIKTSKPNYRELYKDLSGKTFLNGLKKHIEAHYFD